MSSGTSRATPQRPRRGWIVLVAASSAVIVVAAIAIGIALRPPAATTVAATTPADTAPPTSTPAPSSAAPSDFPANTEVYSLDGLPEADVFAIIPALPVLASDSPRLTGLTARAATDAIPVFADPTGQPVATLPRDFFFDGTTVAVLERQSNWAQILLTGRQAAPSSGDSGQLTGWVRTQDVTFGMVSQSVDVDLTARTVDIVDADGTHVRVASDFGSGAEDTPTPLGQSFIMLVRTEPTLAYTDGHPLVYLSVQSPALDGFDGLTIAVTAFHYHDERSGPISNGCIRLDGTAIDRLAQLPEGTPVEIHR